MSTFFFVLFLNCPICCSRSFEFLQFLNFNLTFFYLLWLELFCLLWIIYIFAQTI